MSDLYQTSADIRSDVQSLARIERPSAALTLTRSSSLAITTAGTTITWQTEVRNQGFTWSTTDITIPTSGFYLFNFVFKITTTNQTALAELKLNGNLQSFMATNWNTTNAHSFTQMIYCTTSDVVQVVVTPTTNDTIAVTPENGSRPSPLLHIAQLTGVI